MDTNLADGVWYVGVISGFGDTMAWQMPAEIEPGFLDKHSMEDHVKARYFTFYQVGPGGRVGASPWFGYASKIAPLGEWARLQSKAIIWMTEADRDAKRKLDAMWGQIGAKSGGLAIVEGGKEI
jgi:hypothetical protein